MKKQREREKLFEIERGRQEVEKLRQNAQRDLSEFFLLHFN